jgi:hypothetical protein
MLQTDSESPLLPFSPMLRAHQLFDLSGKVALVKGALPQ